MGGKEGPHDHTPSAIAQTTARPKSRNHEDLLRTLLEREARLCPPTHQPGQPVPKAHPDAVGASERDLEAAWIVSSARRLHLDGDVSGLAIAILDRLIQNTTVFVRYVNCAAVAALFIACKLLEDSGLGADAGEFLSRLHLRGRYSPAELKRMEISILTHLDWDVMLPSAERFLSLLLSSIGGTSVSSAVRARLEVVLTQSRVSWAFRPSTLALAVLSHLLEAQTPLTWLNTTHAFLRRLEIDGSDLIVCREMVSEVWAICEQQQRAIAAIMGARKRVTRRKKRTSSHASSGWKMGGAPLVQRMNSAQLMGLCPEAKRSKSPWSVCEEENTESCDLAEALKILYQQS